MRRRVHAVPPAVLVLGVNDAYIPPSARAASLGGVELEVVRDGAEQTVTVTLDDRPS